MNEITNFIRKIDLFSEKFNKRAKNQLLQTKKESLNHFNEKTDNLTKSEIEQKSEDILKKLRGY